MLVHYGAVADPARVCDPNRKGTVENAIQHTQNSKSSNRPVLCFRLLMP